MTQTVTLKLKDLFALIIDKQIFSKKPKGLTWVEQPSQALNSLEKVDWLSFFLFFVHAGFDFWTLQSTAITALPQRAILSINKDTFTHTHLSQHSSLLGELTQIQALGYRATTVNWHNKTLLKAVQRTPRWSLETCLNYSRLLIFPESLRFAILKIHCPILLYFSMAGVVKHFWL